MQCKWMLMSVGSAYRLRTLYIPVDGFAGLLYCIATSKGPATTASKKNVQSLENVPGTTSLPVARVQRIVKADKDIQMVNKEAIFAISIVTVRS